MRKLLTLLAVTLFLLSCDNGSDKVILPGSTGRTNKILIVIKSSEWLGEIGDEIRTVFGEHVIGLPQPETLLSVGQVAPKGYVRMMKKSKSILIIEKGDKETFTIKKNKYAAPQIIISLTAKDKAGLINQIKTHGKEIIKEFKEFDLIQLQKRFAKKKLDISKFKTLQNLKISLTVPNSFRLVDDTGEFLWLRQHLSSGIARGDGTNNILVYSVPLTDEATVADNIVAVRDTIGKKYIPGSKEGRYMITEAAFTPATFDATIAGKKAFETRGKWEVKNDFMAGPFLNYTVIDKKNNRLIVVEGFTYAPSVNKREFIFELEAIAKSLEIN